jgi:predicted nicotinamide N-methyase
MTGQPFFPEVPAEILGPIIRETVIVDNYQFIIERPDQTEKLIDNPLVAMYFAADEYLPYWVDLWPASRMLARAVLRGDWPAGTEAIEIGCGLGLPGIAALAKGLRVTFSDYDVTAMKFATANAKRNGYSNFTTLAVDWRCPPEGLTFPLILGSDLVYERRHVEPLVGVVKKLLAPEGVCLLTDQDRPPAPFFRETLEASGLIFTTELARAGEPGGKRYKGTLYRIRQPR